MSAETACAACGRMGPAGSQYCPWCGWALSGQQPHRRAAEDGWGRFLERCWAFFASTRVGAALLILLALASVVGSLVEQEGTYPDWRPPELYYPDRYGPFWGPLLMKLGITHTYTSVWYIALVLLLVISLIVASLHRLIPLHRSLRNPRVWKLPHFLRRQDVVAEVTGDLESLSARLRRRGYRVLRDRECLYADKGRISRYGPYVIHAGLLIICFAAFAKAIPGWDESRDVWVPDGHTVMVPGTDFAITNHGFTMELYPNGMPSRYATDAAIVVDGQEVLRQTIEVNRPLSYGGWEIYQASWREEPGTVHIHVLAEGMDRPLATLAVDLRQPEKQYPVTDRLSMEIVAYYHDFALDPETGEPVNASYEVRNPALLVQFVDHSLGKVVGRAGLLVFSREEPLHEGPLKLAVDRVDIRRYSALKLARDRTVPYMYAGLAVMMAGMILTFYFHHWQVWVREEDGRLLVGARAYRNKFGLRRELARLLDKREGEGGPA
ncbi:MAG TPA: cytochrome c biogenesis protein ResB [Symbiobacteriaceae bacterium]